MRAAILVGVLCLAGGCKKSGYADGFAVAVTITPGSLTSDQVGAVRALAFSVTGGDTWDNLANPYPVSDQLQKGAARWLYRPTPGATGKIVVDVHALDEGGHLVAAGMNSVDLAPGATASVKIELGSSSDDLGTGEDGGAVDAGPDLAPVPLAKGVPCVAGRDLCAAGLFCVDKVCCDARCDDPCHSCSVEGAVGTCTAVPNGVQPTHGNCPLKSPNDPVTPCSTDGTCDGHGNCRLYLKNTLCRPQSCVGNTYNPPAICDGMGACVNLTSYPCAPFACNSTGSCFGPPCATDNSTCFGGATCDATTHSCGVLPDGRACTSDNQCANGHCVDDVCCESACSGQCQACDADLGQLGKCLPVTGAPHSNHGQRLPCSGNAMNNCGGVCDPSKPSSPMACEYPPATQSCVSASCMSAMYVTAQSCDGQGSCPVKPPAACPSVMNATAVCSGNGCGYQCNQYFLDCSNGASDGCEVDSRSDSQNCGTCGNNCLSKGQTCVSGTCKCPSGQKPCANTCIANSACCTPADCGCSHATPYTGSCGASFPYGWTCSFDVCASTPTFADPQYSNCGGNCGLSLLCCQNP